METKKNNQLKLTSITMGLMVMSILQLPLFPLLTFATAFGFARIPFILFHSVQIALIISWTISAGLSSYVAEHYAGTDRRPYGLITVLAASAVYVPGVTLGKNHVEGLYATKIIMFLSGLAVAYLAMLLSRRKRLV